MEPAGAARGIEPKSKYLRQAELKQMASPHRCPLSLERWNLNDQPHALSNPPTCSSLYFLFTTMFHSSLQYTCEPMHAGIALHYIGILDLLTLLDNPLKYLPVVDWALQVAHYRDIAIEVPSGLWVEGDGDRRIRGGRRRRARIDKWISQRPRWETGGAS